MLRLLRRSVQTPSIHRLQWKGETVLPIVGVKVAKVVQVLDPLAEGRVQVSFFLGTANVQEWARTVHSLVDSKTAGTNLAIGDQVLLAFEDGKPERAFVLGKL
jgi:hypothetical protein